MPFLIHYPANGIPVVDGSDFQVAGFYTQAYNQIVVPERVWGATRYFIRRWGPRLGPTRFWTVIAARQLAYRNQHQDWFDAYNEQFAEEAHLSKAHLKRIKEEMGHTDDVLSLYLTKDETRYEVIDGRPRPRPTTYHIRLDDLLTPEDANQLVSWLRQRKQGHDPVDVIRLLNRAANTIRTDLLAPPVSTATADAKTQPITTLSVVKAVWNKSVATNGQVKATAEMLQQYLIGSPIYGTQYFRQKWLDILGAGPAFLVVYLRSLCYISDQAGEMRDTVTFTRPELAERLNVTSKTLTNWLDIIIGAVPTQALPPFLHLLENKRTPQNDVEYTYQVGLVDPLAPEDLGQYDLLLQKASGEGVMEKMSLTETLLKEKMSLTRNRFTDRPQGKNEPDETPGHGINELHNRGTDTPNKASTPENTSVGMMEKMSQGQRRNEPGLEKIRADIPYYYNLLLSPLKALDIASMQEENWHIVDGQAQEPVARALGGVPAILHKLGVNQDDPLYCLDDSAYDLVVGWYVYALSQPIPLSGEWIVLRLRQAVLPPQEWIELARLSWELWRCYACLTQLPPTYHDLLRGSPAFEPWMRSYGRRALQDIPFGVGNGLDSLLPQLKAAQRQAGLAEVEELSRPTPQQAKIWQIVLEEIRLTTAKITFNLHLSGAKLVRVQDTEWVIGVRNTHSVAWIENRLSHNIEEYLQWIIQAETDVVVASIQTRYVVLDESPLPEQEQPGRNSIRR